VQLSGLPVDTRNFSRDFVIKSFLRAADAPPAQRHPFWLGSFIPDSADDPLRADWRRQYPLERVVEPAVRAYHEAGDNARLQRLSYQYCKTYLAGDILAKVDRASMAVSLEARSPFLDSDVVAFLVNLKPSSKLWLGWRSKHILRRTFRHVLPKEVLRRPKKGFGIPVAEWFKGPLREHLLELLDGRRLKRAGFFEASVVERLVAEHLRGRRDNRKLLWTLFVFELFRDRYGITSA
jgi:asparagine synthase (glutamine-hydrolysing)